MATKSALCIALVVMLAAPAAFAQRSQEESKVIPLEGAKTLQVSVDFGVGRLYVRGSDLKDEARLNVFYDPRYVDFDVDYIKRGDEGRLVLESEIRKSRRSHDDDELDNEWNLDLPTDRPMALDIEIGACEADMDLGGLRLTDLDLDIGASSGRIEFTSPNPERMKSMVIHIGAASLDFRDLGWANAERIECEVGAGSCDLDFRGGVSGECFLDLDVGVGSADIDVPKDIALRVEGNDGWFSDIDFSGLDLKETRRDVWETDNFDEAKDRLTIRADVSMGSIEIHGRR